MIRDDEPGQCAPLQHTGARARAAVDWPTLPVARSSAVAAAEHLRHQLTGLAEGQHTLHRLIDIARERVEIAWDGLTPQDIDALDSWLNSRVGVVKGEARLRWGFVRGVFDTVRIERGT